MNPSDHEIPRSPDERSFDLVIALPSGIVSGAFTERIIDYIQTKPPEWGVAISGLGFVAVTFGGIATYYWKRAFDTTTTDNNRPTPPAEK